MIYACELCYNQFEAKHRTALCPKCKATPSICVICGKEFPKMHPYTQKTCSPECRGKYRASSGIAKQGAAKMKATKVSRYGTLDPTKVAVSRNGGELNPRTCPLCGKQFIPSAVRQVYCSDIHYGPCPICGKLTEIKDYSIGPQACSEECRMARINKTCLEKYGNKDAVNSEHARQVARTNCLEKYGSEFYSQTDEYKSKYSDTMQTKYGGIGFQSTSINAKIKSTMQERYGDEHASKVKEIKDKAYSTTIQKYGGIGLSSPILRDRIIETNNKKYGCDFGLQNDEIQEKAKQSLLAKYGKSNYWGTREDLVRRIVDETKVDEYMLFKKDPKTYIQSNYAEKPTVHQLMSDLGVSDTPIYDILVANNCSDLVVRKSSQMEAEVRTYLSSLVSDDDIIVNTRKVISPLELDFYLPKYSFAIECNPTTTHNSTIPGWEGQDPIPYNYHKIKTDACIEQGIFLMHIFGYEWEHKQDILKSMICNALKCNSSKIYARNTYVKEVNYADSAAFLQRNHRQGNCPCKIRLGLFDKHTDELVSLMTFGATRPTIGKVNTDDSNCFELIRFCNRLFTNVVGGASKLLAFFISMYDPHKIVSFSDAAHTTGKLYDVLGFKRVSVSDPGYVWAKPYKNEYKTRVACQKHNLPSMFKDVTQHDLDSKSERQIMIEHGYVQVFDSGTIRWEWIAD